MRRPLGSVWLAIIVGMLGWSLRTLPALPLQAEPTFAAVNEPALPPAYRLRAQLATLAFDLRGKPAEIGLRAHLLPSRSPQPSTCGQCLLIRSDPSSDADVGSAADALPYFPTGPPTVA